MILKKQWLHFAQSHRQRTWLYLVKFIFSILGLIRSEVNSVMDDLKLVLSLNCCLFDGTNQSSDIIHTVFCMCVFADSHARTNTHMQLPLWELLSSCGFTLSTINPGMSASSSLAHSAHFYLWACVCIDLSVGLFFFSSSQDLFFIKDLWRGMPRTEVTAISVISFLINSWHAVTKGRGILYFKNTCTDCD